jgi:hypothetical protein
MKKTLLSTTAIAGAAMLVAGSASAGTVGTKDTMSVTMSGYHVFQARTLDASNSTNTGSDDRGRGYSFSTPEGEFQFTAQAKTEGGITYGFTSEIGVETISADELYGFIKGSFGQVHFGNQDGAANFMNVGAGQANKTYQGVIGGTFGASALDGLAGSGDALLIRQDGEQSIYGDANKIIYLSPRFSGFQIGASWTPQTGSEGADGFNDGASLTGSENVGDIAVNYVGEFEGASIKVSASTIFSDDQEAAGVDMEAYTVTSVGAVVSMAGLTVGASYRNNGDFGVAKNAVGDGGNYLGIGALYQMGPWAFNGHVARGKQDFGDAATEQSNSRWGVGVGYSVAPGWDVMADYLDFSRNNNDGTNGADEDASAFILSNKFTF